MKLDVVIRTHNKREIHVQSEPRYCNADKTTLIKKCIKSLVESCDETDYDIHYWWYDDHSSDDCIDLIHRIFSTSKHKYTYVPLDVPGWNASGLAQFERGRDSDADLVYFVEDDYLHIKSAIREMVEAYYAFKANLGKEVSIHPFDDPDNYKPKWIEPCRIVYGKDRRWRTNTYTTFTFLCNPEIVRKNWSIFYTMATEYGTQWGENNQVHEGTMVNKIWRDEVALFTPITSVALHMAYKEQRDPYMDWKELWDSIGDVQ